MRHRTTFLGRRRSCDRARTGLLEVLFSLSGLLPGGGNDLAAIIMVLGSDGRSTDSDFLNNRIDHGLEVMRVSGVQTLLVLAAK